MTHEPQSHAALPTDTGRGPGYEVRDTNVRAVALAIVGIFSVLIFSQFAMWGLLNSISGGKPEPADALSTPAVILEQKRQLTAEEDAALGISAGRLSIAEAIDRIARDGLPRLPDRPLSEIEVNSHSGTLAPAEKGAKE